MLCLTSYRVDVDGRDVGDDGAHYTLLTRNGGIVRTSSDEYLELNSRRTSSFSADKLSKWKELGLLVDDSIDELSDVLRENNNASKDSTELYLPILPSTACQLGCGYCGQTHTSTGPHQNLSDGILQYLIESFRSGDYKTVRFGLFGAEPFLAFQWLIAFGRKLESFRRVFPEALISSKAVSNGVSATKERVTRLVDEIGLDTIEITLDGLPHVHNVQRSSKNGRDYYKNIVENILALREVRDVELIIRCNVGSESFEHVPAFIDFLTSRSLQDYATLYFAPIHSWGNRAHLMALQAEEYALRELSWKLQLWNYGWKVGFLPRRKKITCLALRRDGVIVAPTGDLFDCSEMPLVPMYKSRAIGHISEGSVADRMPRSFATFNDEILNGKLPCSSCFALPVCGGACPKEWAEGRIPCPSFKHNAEYALTAWLKT